MTRKEFFDSVVPQMIAQILGDALTTTVNGLAQVTSALYSYESQIYTPRRRPLLYQRLVPIDTSDGEGAIGRAYFTMEYRGDTKEIARGSDDMPLADVTGAANYIPFKLGGQGYTYDTEDIRQAALLNFNRIALMPLAAFNVYERAINEHVLFGDTRGGKLNFKEALFTSPQIHVEEIDRPLNWDSPIEDLIAAFLSPLDTVYERSLGTSWANVICVPSRLIDLTEIKPLNDLSVDTILTWVRRVNKTTQETGEPLMIVGVPGLETAGANGGPRIMAYELNPENLVLPLPMPFRFIAPQIRNLTFVVPGEFKYGPVHFRYPKSAVYYDYPVESNLFTSRRRDLLAGAASRRDLPKPVESAKVPNPTPHQEPAHARRETR